MNRARATDRYIFLIVCTSFTGKTVVISSLFQFFCRDIEISYILLDPLLGRKCCNSSITDSRYYLAEYFMNDISRGINARNIGMSLFVGYYKTLGIEFES